MTRHDGHTPEGWEWVRDEHCRTCHGSGMVMSEEQRRSHLDPRDPDYPEPDDCWCVSLTRVTP